MMKLSFSARNLFFPVGASHLQLTLSMLWGSWLGLTPTLVTLHSIVLLLSLVIIRMPLLLLGMTALLCWGLGFVGLDALIDAVGTALLRQDSLRDVWTSLYNMPVVPWTRFNNSMVLGSFVLGSVLLPLWIFLSVMIRRSQKPVSEQ
jgi:uncharacterized protein (TIGR03546 family)